MINYINAAIHTEHIPDWRKQNTFHHLSHPKLKDLVFALTNHCCAVLWSYITKQESHTVR